MNGAMANCIYCGRFFNSQRGEGDHILSVRLFGLFEGDKTFRGVCTTCNNAFGRVEQMLSQASPLGHLRRLVQPKLGRSRRGGGLRQRGYKGARPPMTTVEIDGRKQLVKMSDDAPATCSPVDQLVVVDSSGDEHYVPLFRGMSAGNLRAAIQKTGVTQTNEYCLYCDEETSDEFINLAREVLSPSRVEELPAMDAGTQRVPARTEFQFGEDYFRAVAKIALHYYLVYSERGFCGNEPCFREIRRFIRHGAANHEQFFWPSGGGLVTRYGKTLSGEAILPGECCHVLAVSESSNAITVYLQFYLGPENNPRPYYITLAKIESPIVLPRRAWGHVYQIERGRKDRKAGRVVTATIRPLS